MAAHCIKVEDGRLLGVEYYCKSNTIMMTSMMMIKAQPSFSFNFARTKHHFLTKDICNSAGRWRFRFLSVQSQKILVHDCHYHSWFEWQREPQREKWNLISPRTRAAAAVERRMRRNLRCHKRMRVGPSRSAGSFLSSFEAKKNGNYTVMNGRQKIFHFLQFHHVFVDIVPLLRQFYEWIIPNINFNSGNI